jgi:hypothetical protein
MFDMHSSDGDIRDADEFALFNRLYQAPIYV